MMDVLLRCSLQLTRIILLYVVISKAVFLFSSAAISVPLSQRYTAAGHTGHCISRLFSCNPSDLSSKERPVMNDLAMPSLAMISLLPSPVADITAPRYLKDSAFSNLYQTITCKYGVWLFLCCMHYSILSFP